MSELFGESFIVLPPYSENGAVIYGRNACRTNEGEAAQEILYIPGNDNTDNIKCNSIEIEGLPTFSTILNKPAGFWGADSGANDKGVCIGITFTENEPAADYLMATDLTRLGLERSSTAEEAVNVITELYAKHGPNGESKDSTKYCFVIADKSEAWLLNIVGNLWAAENIKTGSKSIPIGLSVSTQIDKSSEGLSKKAEALSLWAGNGQFNFSGIFSLNPVKKLNWPESALEPPHVGEGKFKVTDMFSVLRNTAKKSEANRMSSHVSVLSSNGVSCHWFTGTPHPNESVFKPFIFTPNVRISNLTKILNDTDNKTQLLKYHEKRNWNLIGELLNSLEASCVEEVDNFLLEHSEPTSELDELMKDCVEAEIKFYR